MMRDEKTIKGNKSIARFMGLEKIVYCWRIEEHTIDNLAHLPDKKDLIHEFLDEDLLYHKSYDWLMPVVEKIRLMTGVHRVEWQVKNLLGGITSYGQRQFFSISARLGETKWETTHSVYTNPKWITEERENSGVWHRTSIEAIYAAVVEFIEYYNNLEK